MKFPGRYILVNCVPVEEPSLIKWGKWLEVRANRRVALTRVGLATISTVFLGLNQSCGDGPPILFETMVSDCPFLGFMIKRYSTWQQAEAGHKAAVEKVQSITVFN